MVSLELRSHTLRHTCTQDKRLPPAVREPAQAAVSASAQYYEIFCFFIWKLILYCEIILHSPHTDFIEKSTLAQKEFYETEYWLELLFETNCMNEENYKALQNDCGSIRRMLTSSLKTIKSK